MAGRKPATFREWMEKNFDGEELRDIAEHGAAAGFSGLTYYKDTMALYDEYSDEIWDMVGEMTDALGYKSALQTIASFGGAGDVANDAQFENLLVWFAAEEIARNLVE